MKNAVNWFEIPAAEEKRAVAFYEALYDQKLHHAPMGDANYYMLPSDQEGVGGALTAGSQAKPSADGATVFLNAGEDLQPMLDRIEPAGGKVLLPKTEIPGQFGFMALFIDSEGNRLALHSPK